MVTPQLRRVFENEGVGLIPLEAVADPLESAKCSTAGGWAGGDFDSWAGGFKWQWAERGGDEWEGEWGEGACGDEHGGV